MCEDYRAGAYADYEIDKADLDAGKKITIPMLALWGDAGVASAATTPLDTWKKWATKVEGAPVDSGHFLPEENPEVTAKLLREFFLAELACTSFRHSPRRRGYPVRRGLSINHGVSGILDCFASRAYDAEFEVRPPTAAP